MGKVRVWDVATLSLLTTLKGHLSDVVDVQFFPDGRRLAVASADSIQLWDLDVSQELVTLKCPDSRPQVLAVAPDGESLYALLESGAVRSWKTR